MSPTETTQYTAALDAQRRYFATGATLDIGFRKQQLKTLQRLLNENKAALVEAVYQDIHRCHQEGELGEVIQIVNEIDTILGKIDEWAKPKPVKRSLAQLGDKAAYIAKDPLGLVLIISPWNYPVQLMLNPVVGAIAAGNCVVIKPSEVAANSARVVAELMPKYFAPEYIRVIEGGVPETTALLKERFDHIFYTGAPAIGKIVMAAAAKHLTPVTLELGGKCPAIIDPQLGDMKVAARRIAWGKFISCGQTCVAPDHVLCLEKDVPALVQVIKDTIREFYGENPQASEEYARIISERHFDRLAPYLQNGGGQLVMGGKIDREDLYMEPAVLTGVKFSDPIMQEEIFGPILPIVTVPSMDAAVEQINERSLLGHKPLALYIFSDDTKVVEDVVKRTSSGGVTANDCLMHMLLDTLPFGGVGYSGMGRYHGKFSFDTFTHEKAVLHRPLTGESMQAIRYPPYDARKKWWSSKLFRKIDLPDFAFLGHLPALIVGLLLGYLLTLYRQ